MAVFHTPRFSYEGPGTRVEAAARTSAGARTGRRTGGYQGGLYRVLPRGHTQCVRCTTPTTPCGRARFAGVVCSSGSGRLGLGTAKQGQVQGELLQGDRPGPEGGTWPCAHPARTPKQGQ